MMLGHPNLLPEGDVDSVEDKDMRKRARYLRRCKDVLWSRWTGEYIKSLRERHNLNHNKGGPPIEQGDVALIQSDERNRDKWNIGFVVKLIKGRDGIFLGARSRAGKSFLERAVQQLCLMELSCDRFKEPEVPVPNPHARVITPRTAAIVAAKNIKDIAEREKEMI